MQARQGQDHWTISDGDCALTVAARGAETVSLILGGVERLWQPRPDVWSSVSPLLFPVVGRLRHGGLMIGDMVYPLDAHGFARRRRFRLLGLDDRSVTLVDDDDAETRALWPFAYQIQVVHRVTPLGFASTFQVANRGDVPLGFSLGAHPGFALPIVSRPGWAVRFSGEGCTGPHPTRDRLLEVTAAPVCRSIALEAEAFRDGAVYFGAAAGRTVSVITPTGGEAMTLTLGGQSWLALWSVPGADLLCLEPLHGTTDAPDASGRLTDKRGILWLAPGKTWTDGYEVTLSAP